MAKGFSNPKATIHLENGFDFLKNQFDINITDSSDPEGIDQSCFFFETSLAESMLQRSFYSWMKSALHLPYEILCC
jgi:spermidine synthase